MSSDHCRWSQCTVGRGLLHKPCIYDGIITVTGAIVWNNHIKSLQPALLHPTAHTAKSPQWIRARVVAPPIPFGNPTVTRACRRFGWRGAGCWLEGVVGEVRVEPTEGEAT